MSRKSGTWLPSVRESRLDRNRGGSYLSVLISGAGLFGVFLFLTYYLQKTLLYSPVVTGLAFLPMVVMIVIGGTTANAVLLPRFGPKPLVPTGGARHGAPGATRRALDLRGVHPAGAARDRARARFDLRAVDQHRDAWRRPGRRRRGVGHREQLPAGGRVDRHRVPEHDRHDCRDELPRLPRSASVPRRRGLPRHVRRTPRSGPTNPRTPRTALSPPRSRAARTRPAGARWASAGSRSAARTR
jgi:hypothetical protein